MSRCYNLTCILVLAAGMSWAQDAVPLTISGMSITADNTRVFMVTNTSGKKIAAYSLVAGCTDSCTYLHTAIRGLHPQAPVTVFQPGESWKEKFRLPPTVTATPSVDYVLFADGSFWGPDAAKSSLAIDGKINGFRLAKERLKDLMNAKGVQAVAEYLNH